MRHPHHRVVGVVQTQPMTDPLRRPLQTKAGLHRVAQHRHQGEPGHLGTAARTKAAVSAAAARKASRPPLRATSRLTVVRAHPSPTAITRNDSPQATPRDISSRATPDSYRGDRTASNGRTPPCLCKNRATCCPGMPSRRPIDDNDPPARNPTHTCCSDTPTDHRTPTSPRS